MPAAVGIAASVYRRSAEISAEDCAIMLIDRQYLEQPYRGSRRLTAWLATQGHVVNRRRVRGLMRLAGSFRKNAGRRVAKAFSESGRRTA